MSKAIVGEMTYLIGGDTKEENFEQVVRIDGDTCDNQILIECNPRIGNRDDSIILRFDPNELMAAITNELRKCSIKD